MTQPSSYSQILKSSSIMGGAAGINLLLGMVRVKFASVLIGTAGVGLMASLTSIQGLIGTLFGLGIQSSAVREVAAAVGKNDDDAVGRAVLTLRRICWLTGLAGMAAMMLLSPLLSQLTFGNNNYTYDIAALGLIVLFGNLSGGQMALINGMRRIGDLAQANIMGAVFATGAAIGFYSWLGLRGIVPALVSIAAMQLLISWYFARRVSVPVVAMSWLQTMKQANGMVRLGLVFMWTGLMSAGVSYLTVMLISNQIGIQAVGLYSSAFNLSGVFVNFVLQAMAADYYPRLTGVAGDKPAMTRMVNEQTEIGLLLALPGLLATMALAPWIIQLFYTKEFLPAVELLQWFILGCLGRVISWPLGFVMIALGKSGWIFWSELSMNLLHVLMIGVGIKLFGLNGIAFAYAFLYVIHIVVTYVIAHKLIDFIWGKSAKSLLIYCLSISILVLTVALNSSVIVAITFGSVAVLLSCIFSLKQLQSRVGPEHWLSKIISKLDIIK